MDFKEFLKDKHGYDAILVIINWLEKDLITILYHKIINARGLTTFFII